MTNLERFIVGIDPADAAARFGQKLIVSTDFVEVGRFSYGTPKFVLFPSSSPMRIGSFCSISDEVTFVMGGEHDTGRVTTYPLNMLLGDFSLPWMEREKGPIVVGNDVWIGYGATILSGVTIGDGAVIGARSVVTRDVPPYCVVAGNPARVLRPRFSPEAIQWLQALKWWEWDIDTIRASADALLSVPSRMGAAA